MKKVILILKLVLAVMWFVLSLSCSSKSDLNQSNMTVNSNNSTPIRTATPKLPDVFKINWGDETYETSACREKLGHPQTIKFTLYEFKADSNRSKYAYFLDKKTVFGDLDGDGIDEAVVGIVCGSREIDEMTFEIQIFTVENNKKKFLARVDDISIEKDYQKSTPKGWIVAFNKVEVKDGRLVVKVTTDGTKIIPAYMSTFTYKLNNGNFVLEGKPAKVNI